MKSKFSRIAIFRDEFCSKVSSWGKEEREKRERERERERDGVARSLATACHYPFNNACCCSHDLEGVLL